MQFNLADQSIPVDDAGVAALNKTEQGPFVQVIDSDPKSPTYGAILEVFHHLHCLVSCPPISRSLCSSKY